MEIFKDIKGYEGMYQISDLGNVKSLERLNSAGKHIKERLLKKDFDPTTGYYSIGLNKDGKSKRLWIHRLVADAFLANPNKYPQVNHKDENKRNNNVDNLEWCTETYNQVYTNGKQVLKYDNFGNLLAVYPSNREAATANNVSISTISRWCKKGNNWKYA